MQNHQNHMFTLVGDALVTCLCVWIVSVGDTYPNHTYLARAELRSRQQSVEIEAFPLHFG